MQFVTVSLRIPAPLKAWLEAEAARNFRSMTGEAVARLETLRRAEEEPKAAAGHPTQA